MRRWTKGWLDDEPPRSFDTYARALTLRHSELLLISFIAAVLVGALIDLLTGAHQPRVLGALAWRGVIIGMSVSGLFTARQLRNRTVCVHTAVAAYAVAGSALVGAWLADCGGANPAWLFAGYAVPLAVLPLVIPLRVRVVVSVAAAVACAAGYLAVHPARISNPVVLGANLTLLTVAAMGVLLGDHYFRLVRAHHGQRAHMAERIADGTRRLRQLLAEIERTQLEERRRIGRELHDELAQTLTALKLEVSLAHRKAVPGTATADALARIDALSNQLVHAKNCLVVALRPATLDELGFERAVQSHISEVARRYGLAIDLQREPAELSVPEPTANTLYRALQEALTNIVRHACATAARVRITREGDDYLLEVVDDGVGFDPNAVDGAHFGLLGMRERAAIAGGTVTVVSAPGDGTRVTVRLPVTAPPAP